MRRALALVAFVGGAHDVHALPSSRAHGDLSMSSTELPSAAKALESKGGGGGGGDMDSEKPRLQTPVDVAHQWPAHSVMRAKTKSSFLLAQVADIHLTGNSTFDHAFYGQVRNVLERFDSVELAVLSGDQIVAAGMDKSQVENWDKLVAVLTGLGIPHTAMLGNHDAEPFLAERGYDFNVADSVTNGTEWRTQMLPGARVSRPELMAHDAQLPDSLSQSAPDTLGNASSAFVLDVMPPEGGDRPMLTIIHMDTGDGGMPIGVEPKQRAWFKSELAQHSARFGASAPPILVFAHFPFGQTQKAWEQGQLEPGMCWGENRDQVTPDRADYSVVLDDADLMQAIWETPQVAGVFSGHLHCNNFCCVSNSTNLCFAQHSSPGGYHCGNAAAAGDSRGYSDPNVPTGFLHFETDGANITKAMSADPLGFGMRMLEVTTHPNSSWQVETFIQLTNGSLVHRRVLAEGGGM